MCGLHYLHAVHDINLDFIILRFNLLYLLKFYILEPFVFLKLFFILLHLANTCALLCSMMHDITHCHRLRFQELSNVLVGLGLSHWLGEQVDPSYQADTWNCFDRALVTLRVSGLQTLHQLPYNPCMIYGSCQQKWRCHTKMKHNSGSGATRHCTPTQPHAVATRHHKKLNKALPPPTLFLQLNKGPTSTPLLAATRVAARYQASRGVTDLSAQAEYELCKCIQGTAASLHPDHPLVIKAVLELARTRFQTDMWHDEQPQVGPSHCSPL